MEVEVSDLEAEDSEREGKNEEDHDCC